MRNTIQLAVCMMQSSDGDMNNEYQTMHMHELEMCEPCARDRILNTQTHV